MAALLFSIASCAGSQGGTRQAPPVPPLPSHTQQPATDEQRARALLDKASRTLEASGQDAGAPAFRRAMAPDVESLTQLYVGDHLTRSTRDAVLRLLFEVSDDRARAASVHALRQGGAEDVSAACLLLVRAARDLGRATADSDVIDALWEAVDGVHRRDLQAASVPLREALDTLCDDSCTERAVRELDAPAPADAMLLWLTQESSVELIGRHRYTSGVRSLVRALVAPGKQNLVRALHRALATMPQEAEPLLTGALDGTDRELAQAAAALEETAGSIRLADALGFLSTPSARDSLLNALSAAREPLEKAALARALANVPRTPKTVAAFRKAYASLPPKTPWPEGGLARTALAATAWRFFDPSVTGLVVGDAAREVDREAASDRLWSAVNLMTRDQVPMVALAVRAVGALPGPSDELDKLNAHFTAAKDVLTACGTRTDCYLNVLDEPVADDNYERQGKACMMIAMTGGGARGSATRAALVGKLRSEASPALRGVIVIAIDALSPEGDDATADELRRVRSEDLHQQEGANPYLVSADRTLLDTELRLRARRD